MRNKKLLALFICLVCISVCVFLLTACGGNNTEETTTEPSESVLETTEPEASAPPVEETTQEPGEETTEEATEETTEEPTEPATQPSSKPGGSTQVTTPQTTQPEEETEPEETIAVPAPGTENNAYVENFTSITGQFTTVKIPAGEKIWYKLKTPGHFLQINHQDVWVIYGEKTYKPVDGVLEIPLPADGSKSIAMQFVNKGAEEQQFSVSILDAKGTASNPNVITSVKDLSVSIDKGDTDGIHYVWTADSDGMLRVGVASASSKNTSIDVALTVNGITVKLTDNASNVVEIAVSKGDQVAVAITSVDGKEVTAVISGYVVPMQQLTVAKVPSSEETVSVPAQESVIYQIFGANGTVMRIKHKTVTVICNGTVYTPDENGFIKLELSSDPMQLELCNTGNKAQAYTLSFSYPLGHSQNPEKLTEIKDNTVKAQLSGYWYTYTAEASGQLTISTEKENVEIFMLNNRTQQYANLWYTNENGESVQGENVCVAVEAGDKISLQLLYGSNIELQITGQIIPVGTITLEQLPYSVKSEKVTAGSYVLYNISGAADSVLTIASKDVAVIMDGVTYKPDDSGLVSVSVKADAVSIQLCNNGSKDTVYTLKFDHCLGSEEKPEELSKLDAVKVDLQKGVYYYTYTSKTTGKLSFSTDHADTYIVLTNETTEETASMWYTGEDGQVVKSDSVSVAVNKGDVITVQVVSAEADVTEATVTGKEETIVALTVQQLPHQVESVSIPAGGYVYYDISGVNGNMLTIKAKNVAVVLNGTTYKPDENNILSLKLDEEPVRIQLCNTGKTKTTYMMNFHYPVGHTENAEMLTQLGSLDVIYENGSYNYTYTAQVDGQVSFSANDTDTYIVLTNETTGETNNLWHTDADGQVVKNDSVSVDAKPGDVISIQVFAMADGQTQSTVTGWEDAIIDLAVESLPYSADTEKIAAGAGVIYDISGIAGNMLSIESSSVEVIYNGEVYQPDESGIVTVRLVTEPARVQLCNTGDAETAYTMNFHYPVGHPENPEKLTALGELDVVFEGGSYYYAYTAQLAGRVVFGTADQDTYIVLINETAEETNNLWHTDADGQVVKNDSVSVDAKPGDVISIQVFAMADGQTESTVTGWEDAIIDLTVESLPYSADTEKIAAGAGVIYDISGIAGNMLSIESASVEVIYNGEVYQPDESGIVTVRLVTEPARVQIYNTGNGETAYTMNFHYPVGHPENPENLTALGELDVVFEGGGYYYTYTAQITGRVVFGTVDQDTYIVLVNQTTEQTASLWYTDDNDQVVKNEIVGIDVTAGDVITIQVFAMAEGMTETAISGCEAYVHALTEDQLPTSFDSETVGAGNSLFYLISGIDGNVLNISGENLSVSYSGESYVPDENGNVELKLSDDKLIEISNTGDEEAVYTLSLDYALGHYNKPAVLDELGQIDVVSEKESYSYIYTALNDGKVIFTTEMEDVDIILTSTTTEASAKLWNKDENDEPVRSDYVGVPVLAGEQVHIQVISKTDAAVQAQVTGFEAVVLELSGEQLPTAVETAAVAAGKSIYYEISGICGNMLDLDATDTVIIMNGTTYEPDEAGHIQIKLGSVSHAAVLVQICNNSEQEISYELNFSFPIGHSMNPEILTELGEITAIVEAGTDGYYYSYTVQKAGQLVMNLWESPEDTLTDMILTNSRTEESVSLWTEVGGEFVFNYSSAMLVLPGDVITVQVTITSLDDASVCIDGQAVLYGSLCGGEDSPIQVQLPGFTAQIPAGETLYYQGYNLSELLLSVSGKATITYNGNTYEPIDGVASCILLTSGRMPAVFAITNTGSELTSYEVEFLYPVGHNQNPETLQLGTNTVNKVLAGMSDHIYTYVVPKDGTLKLTFDPAAQWVYAVDNVDQGVYGESCHSNDDPQINETQLQVSTGDTIQIRVNTFDPENPGTNPAGTVSFTADLYTGPVAITDITAPYQVDLLAGETVMLTANAFGQQMKMLEAQNVTVTCAGETYTADESGLLQLVFPANGGDEEVLEFTVHNGSTADKTVTLLFGEQKGTADNPDTFNVGGINMAVCDAGSEGYHYTFTAEKAGMLRLILSDGYTWKIKFGNSTYTSDKTPKLSMYLQKGKTVELIIYTYDPTSPDEVPAGSVEFTVTFG